MVVVVLVLVLPAVRPDGHGRVRKREKRSGFANVSRWRRKAAMAVRGPAGIGSDGGDRGTTTRRGALLPNICEHSLWPAGV